MAYHHLISRQATGLPSMPQRSPEYLAENQAPRLLAIECSLFTLSTLTVLLRFYVRIFMLNTFGWDDAMMAIAAAISTTTLALFLRIVDFGLGLHAEAFPLVNIFPFFRVMYAYSILIILGFSFIKLSIGFFLLRLADRTRWRPFLVGTLIFLAIFTVGSTFAIVFQCTPIQAGWDYTLRPPTGTAKCYSTAIFKNVGVFNSSVNIATDLLFALIPIPMVWRLQVNVQTRIGLAIILSLGLFASATAIYKTPMQYNFFKETDWSGNGSWYYIWQQVEMHVGIIAACLPTLKPLFANFFGQIRTLTRGRTVGSSGISTPFKSSGYIQQKDQDGFKMSNMGAGSRTRTRHPYDEDAMLGKETYSVEARGRLSRVRSSAAESDKSILDHDVPDATRTLARGMAIVRTTEVNITR